MQHWRRTITRDGSPSLRQEEVPVVARIDVDAWIPEAKASGVLTKIAHTSAAERFGRHEPMNTPSKSFNRSGGVDLGVIGKSQAYGEDTSENDDVLIEAVKFGVAIRIAEEDLADTPEAIINIKKLEWATSWAILEDNAAFGVSGVKNKGTVPFTSVYSALSHDDASTEYTANENIVKTAGELTYEDLSDVLAVYEESQYYNEARTFIVAHPKFKNILRKLKDGEGRLIYQESVATGTPGTLFGIPIVFSLGAQVTATATSNPNGRPLLIVGNGDLLIVGDRTSPESFLIDPNAGLAALTDEAILKMRVRKAIGVGHPRGFAALEITPAA
jgi:HK97 family phage major capsid protein